jgi:spore germination cell wall hydrolase CwlJ-like protein
MGYTLIIPDQDIPFTNVFMMALAIFREAEGEPPLGKLAVGYVIKNRVALQTWFGTDICSVITKPFQFSSFNIGNPRSVVFGAPGNAAWGDSIQAAMDVIQSNLKDPTDGATHFCVATLDPLPEWTKTAQFKIQIGNHSFWKAA